MEGRKTRAILNLVEGTPEFRHIVYSLNRRTALCGIAGIPFGADRVAVAFGALPKGIFWSGRLAALADWIVADLKTKGILPHLVEGHKITVEGVVARQVAKAFGCPFACDIQGNSDVRILRNNLLMRGVYKKVAREAALVFPFAPWAVPPFAKLAGLDPAKCRALPVVPEVEGISPSIPLGNARFLSVFNLDQWRLKNLEGLVKALERVAKTIPDVSLDIAGAGSAKAVAEVESLLSRLDKTGRVNLLGLVPNPDLPFLMKKYTGFALATLRETYGLVFAESVMSGLPILYPKGRAIDGYFPPEEIGYACDPESVEDIAAGLVHLISNEKELKESLARLQRDGKLKKLQRPEILKTYRHEISRVLGV